MYCAVQSDVYEVLQYAVSWGWAMDIGERVGYLLVDVSMDIGERVGYLLVDVSAILYGRSLGVVTGGGGRGEPSEQTAGVLLLTVDELLHEALSETHACTHAHTHTHTNTLTHRKIPNSRHLCL